MASVVSMKTQLPAKALLGDIRSHWLMELSKHVIVSMSASGHIMQSCGRSDLNDPICSSELDLLCRQRCTKPEKPRLQRSYEAAERATKHRK